MVRGSCASATARPAEHSLDHRDPRHQEDHDQGEVRARQARQVADEGQRAPGARICDHVVAVTASAASRRTQAARMRRATRSIPAAGRRG